MRNHKNLHWLVFVYFEKFKNTQISLEIKPKKKMKPLKWYVNIEHVYFICQSCLSFQGNWLTVATEKYKNKHNNNNSLQWKQMIVIYQSKIMSHRQYHFFFFGFLGISISYLLHGSFSLQSECLLLRLSVFLPAYLSENICINNCLHLNINFISVCRYYKDKCWVW